MAPKPAEANGVSEIYENQGGGARRGVCGMRLKRRSFPVLGFCGRRKMSLGETKHSSAKAKTAPRGSKKGDWVYTNLILGAKMEIPVNIRIGQVKRKAAESRGAFDSTERIILPRTHKRNHRGRKSLSWRTLLLGRSGPPLGAQFLLQKIKSLDTS